jgi:hypothetical protein
VLRKPSFTLQQCLSPCHTFRTVEQARDAFQFTENFNANAYFFTMALALGITLVYSLNLHPNLNQRAVFINGAIAMVEVLLLTLVV